MAAPVRPRIKLEHTAYRTVDGNVRIGGLIHGIAAEIKDPDGWVWTLVEATDGTRSLDAIVTEVVARHPGLAADDVARAFEQVAAAGFVEDAAATAPGQLSPRERERYSRNVGYFRWVDLTGRTSAWEVQLRLRESRVLLVGVGGTGGMAAQSLVASGVGHLHCVDHDVVELSNLNRQVLFTENDVGVPKVEAALARLRALNSDVLVTGEHRRVRGPDDLVGLLNAPPEWPGPGHVPAGAGYDLLVLAADQPRGIRRWANLACQAANVPWVEGGYRGPLIMVGMFVPGTGPCWECLHTGRGETVDLRLPPGVDETQVTPQLPFNSVSAVTAGLSGSLLTHAALSLLTGAPPIEPGVQFGMNLMVPGDMVVERYPRRADCPGCAPATAVGASSR